MSQEGILFFPMDTGFLRDKKMLCIRGQYGAKGILVVLYLLCRIYEEHGYYIPWGPDDAFISADLAGCGISPGLITQVVAECVRLDLFDGKLFDALGILTSRGIQKRYLYAADRRENIVMIREYLLLDLDDPNKVQTGMLDKVTLLSLKGPSKAAKVSSGKGDETKERKEPKERKYLKTETKTLKTVSNETVRQTDVRRVVERWNELQRFGINPIIRMAPSAKRYDNLQARIREYGLDNILAAISRIGESDFLQGKNRNGWRISFDWFVLPSNFPKVLEGKYDNGRPARSPALPPPNRFHNFEQRNTDYDSIVMDQLKKRLEGSGGQPAAESAGNAAKRQQASG